MRIHDYTDDEYEQIAEIVTNLSRAISELTLNLVNDDGSDPLSQLCAKYNDRYIVTDALAWAVCNVIGSYHASIVSTGQGRNEDGADRVVIGLLYAISSGVSFGKEAFDISNIHDITRLIRQKHNNH